MIVVRWPSEIFPLFTTSDNLALMLSTDEVFFLATIVAAPSPPESCPDRQRPKRGWNARNPGAIDLQLIEERKSLG